MLNIIYNAFILSPFPGLYTGLSPIYNAEVAPDKARGAMGTLNQLAVTVGMLISQVLGLSEILGNDRLWPLLLGKEVQSFTKKLEYIYSYHQSIYFC